MQYGLLLFLVILSHHSLFAQNTKKILLIGMDGCRSDALQIANTPNLDQVIQEGFSCLEARTIPPTMSGPGWASMLTGVWYNKHQVHGNVFIGNQLDQYTHFFNRIEAHKPDLQTFSIAHWAPINDKIIRKVDYKNSPKSDVAVAQEGIQILSKQNPDALFLHFDDIDHAGHFSGFNPKNPKYIKEIEKVDSLIGLVLKTVQSRPTYATEDWLILFSPDHGGIKLSHGGSTEVERSTFIIAQHKNSQPHQVAAQTIKIDAKQLVKFTKAQHQCTIPAFKETQSSKDWTLKLQFKIDEWQSDAFLVQHPQLSIKTHAADQKTWWLYMDNKKIKIQGDQINDQAWHSITISCSQGKLVHVYQNGRIVGLQQSKQALIPITEQALVLNYHKTQKVKSLKWQLYNCSIVPKNYTPTKRQQWLGTVENNSIAPLFDWNDKLLKKKAICKAPKINQTQTLQFKDYSHYPQMVDIAPTLLQHLGIPISIEQKEKHFDGSPIRLNKTQ